MVLLLLQGLVEIVRRRRISGRKRKFSVLLLVGSNYSGISEAHPTRGCALSMPLEVSLKATYIWSMQELRMDLTCKRKTWLAPTKVRRASLAPLLSLCKFGLQEDC